jgi:hypothetical protein
MKYLWVKDFNGDGYDLELVNDPISIFKNGIFDEKKDKLFQIGSEVKLKVSLEPVVYRGTTMEKTVVTRVRGNNPSSPEVTVWEKD